MPTSIRKPQIEEQLKQSPKIKLTKGQAKI